MNFNSNDSVPPSNKKADCMTLLSPHVSRASFLHRGVSVLLRESVSSARKPLSEVISNGTRRHQTNEGLNGANSKDARVQQEPNTASPGRDKSRTTSWGALCQTTGSHRAKSLVRQPCRTGRASTVDANVDSLHKRHTHPLTAVGRLR